MPSAFRSQNQETIQIDGIDEKIIIQPLSSNVLEHVQSIRWSNQRLIVNRGNRQAKNNALIIRYVVNDGIVSVGGQTDEDWSDVLDPAVQARIADKILKLSGA